MYPFIKKVYAYNKTLNQKELQKFSCPSLNDLKTSHRITRTARENQKKVREKWNRHFSLNQRESFRICTRSPDLT